MQTLKLLLSHNAISMLTFCRHLLNKKYGMNFNAIIFLMIRSIFQFMISTFNDYFNFVYCGNYKATKLCQVSEKRTLSYKNLIFWNMR